MRAAAGLIAPGSRRVVVKARYTRIATGDLGATRAHLKHIQRDGVTFTLAPWRQALKPFRGHAVAGIVSTTCVTWTLDRGRSLVTRAP